MPDLLLFEVAEGFAGALGYITRTPFALIATGPLDIGGLKSYKPTSPLVRWALVRRL
jgi:hypothetical protein